MQAPGTQPPVGGEPLVHPGQRPDIELLPAALGIAPNPPEQIEDAPGSGLGAGGQRAGGHAPNMPTEACTPRRIYVAGGAGAGKTTLGRLLPLPHYDWDRGERPDPTSDAWVVEGAHLWAIEPFLAAADVILWLDVSLARTIPRIVLRHIRLSARRVNPHPGLVKLARFVARQPIYRWAPPRPPRGPTDWDALTRAQTEATLAPFQDRVIRLRRPAEVRAWVERVGHARA